MFTDSNPCRYLYGSPGIDFTTAKVANSDSAYWNGAPTLFLFVASSCLCGSSWMINAGPRLMDACSFWPATDEKRR